ncbi:type 1 glutamine amidotransferase domain-containing protein [Robiginitomaculum antarcticum]|uniref:type 1 glutamine amidotransferase domain-containing protein n=1 Tax=Robiginitomaculum antarcticum TaxID=437507 RepID=UPI0003696A75|nr:type 1 glutamine amidotransferase domain-containing protein [Robiginitomaculum antarcticum]
MTNITNSKVLFLATNGFQEEEMFSPYEMLKENGATVHLASFDTDAISAGESDSREITPDMAFDKVNVDDYDAVVLPGGLANPDKLRTSDKAVQIVRDFAKHNKIIAAICHGPWMLAEADILRGRNVTSYKSIKTDLINAGANWTDKEVVVSNGMITSRNPDDIPAFNAKLLEEIREGEHKRTLRKKAA